MPRSEKTREINKGQSITVGTERKRDRKLYSGVDNLARWTTAQTNPSVEWRNPRLYLAKSQRGYYFRQIEISLRNTLNR